MMDDGRIRMRRESELKEEFERFLRLGMSAPSRPIHARSPSLDPKMVDDLEKRLNARPDKSELVDRNILKDDSVAPALQAAKAKLQRSQLEDKLDQALQQRPKPEELVKEGILKEGELPAA